MCHMNANVRCLGGVWWLMPEQLLLQICVTTNIIPIYGLKMLDVHAVNTGTGVEWSIGWL